MKYPGHTIQTLVNMDMSTTAWLTQLGCLSGRCGGSELSAFLPY